MNKLNNRLKRTPMRIKDIIESPWAYAYRVYSELGMSGAAIISKMKEDVKTAAKTYGKELSNPTDNVLIACVAAEQDNRKDVIDAFRKLPARKNTINFVWFDLPATA